MVKTWVELGWDQTLNWPLHHSLAGSSGGRHIPRFDLKFKQNYCECGDDAHLHMQHTMQLCAILFLFFFYMERC